MPRGWPGACDWLRLVWLSTELAPGRTAPGRKRLQVTRPPPRRGVANPPGMEILGRFRTPVAVGCGSGTSARPFPPVRLTW